MKYIYTILLLLGMQSIYSQNTMVASDINGQWQSTKPGAEIYIEIKGTNATITSIGKTSLTQNIVQGNIYDQIKYDGNGVWSAQRNAWIYNGTGGVNSEKGHWENANAVKLNLSSDKNTITVPGHWTYNRVMKKSASN